MACLASQLSASLGRKNQQEERKMRVSHFSFLVRLEITANNPESPPFLVVGV
jgi:hypothetical protein